MRFVTCLGPDGVEEPAVLSADGTAVTPLRWLGLPCDTLTEAIPQLTPAGVGMGMDPPQFLQPGDTVRCEIDGIGSLTNTVR